jgi:hypothetical protein
LMQFLALPLKPFAISHTRCLCSPMLPARCLPCELVCAVVCRCLRCLLLYAIQLRVTWQLGSLCVAGTVWKTHCWVRQAVATAATALALCAGRLTTH